MPVKHTKIATILKLLSRPKGASIAELRKAIGWQDHSVRAALTGLRKKGHTVIRDNNGNVSRYHVSGEQ
jgi:DNA-binding transcriptional regulator PaaX